MEKIIVGGGKKLDGSVRVDSAKNSVLPMLAGSILTTDEVVIKNCPKIKDVLVMIDILENLGVKTTFKGNDLIVNSSNMDGYTIPVRLGGELRSSVFMLGSLLARMGMANLSFPGGCKIGDRPIDIHVAALKSMGADFFDVSTEIVCKASKLKGTNIYLSYPSVGATENLILAGVLAEGDTYIYNSAREPEIKDLACFLRAMGAKIYGEGSDTILIRGVKKLHGTEYTPTGDRIEAGTFIIATLITGGMVEITNVFSQNILPVIDKFCNNTCKVIIKNDIIYIKSGSVVKSFTLTTGPHPEFPTDLQAPATVLACIAEGSSVITETVFENRFLHVPELSRMGADIIATRKRAVINGVKRLHGETVTAMDLRGGAALVLAGLNAEGKTVINDAHHISRGYYKIVEKFSSLGAEIKEL